MNLIVPMEIVIKRNTTYFMMEYLGMLRRIYTDGRSFPPDDLPSWMGYSIGDGSTRTMMAAKTCLKLRPAI